MQSGFPTCCSKGMGVTTFPLLSGFWTLLQSCSGVLSPLAFSSLSHQSHAQDVVLHLQFLSYVFAPLTTWLLPTQSSLCCPPSCSPQSSGLPYSFILCVKIALTIHSVLAFFIHVLLSLPILQKQLEWEGHKFHWGQPCFPSYENCVSLSARSFSSICNEKRRV